MSLLPPALGPGPSISSMRKAQLEWPLRRVNVFSFIVFLSVMPFLLVNRVRFYIQPMTPKLFIISISNFVSTNIKYLPCATVLIYRYYVFTLW